MPYLLAANAPMVVPVNKVVRVLVTGEDVIHSFSVPAFGVKIDAVPGPPERDLVQGRPTGTFYGQCSQLCGINHAFMPIEVKVVSQADFDAWVASKARRQPAVAVAARRRRLRPPRPPPAHAARSGRAEPFDGESSSMADVADAHERAAHADGHDAATATTRTRRASSPAGSCRPTTRTSAPSTSSSPSMAGIIGALLSGLIRWELAEPGHPDLHAQLG